MKKFAKLVACALAFVMMLGIACAETKVFDVDVNEDKENGLVAVDVTDAKSLEIKIDMTDTWGGGGIGWNSVAEDGDWTQISYSNEDEASLTASIDVSDVAKDENGKQTVQIQCWWTNADAPFSVEYTVVKGDAPAEPTEAPAEPADPTDAPDEVPPTGDATSIALLSAIALLAVAGVVVTSKKANN